MIIYQKAKGELIHSNARKLSEFSTATSNNPFKVPIVESNVRPVTDTSQRDINLDLIPSKLLPKSENLIPGLHIIIDLFNNIIQPYRRGDVPAGRRVFTEPLRSSNLLLALVVIKHVIMNRSQDLDCLSTSR